MMTDQNDFVEMLKETLRERGLSLQSIPDTPGRAAYLDFLDSNGYEEAELLPLIDRSKLTGEMYGAAFLYLMEAIRSDDDKRLQLAASMAYNVTTGNHNTNYLIHDISEALVNELPTDVIIPSHYAGVFPIDSPNAQCKTHRGQNLILIDTGCLEMADAVTTCFLSKRPLPQRASEIADLIETYVSNFRRPDPLAVTSTGIDWGDELVYLLTTSVEKFYLAHEMGHLALGHIRQREGRTLNTGHGRIYVEAQTEFEELQADGWACRALINSARKSTRPTDPVAVAIGGVSIALGIGLLVEGASAKSSLDIDDGHPSATDRLYLIETLCEILGAFDEAYIGRRFSELLSELVPARYPAVELPPLLDRDLNRKIIPVIESLGMSYETNWT
jgi:hypothetical protein